jgi:hypothetical protein
MNISYTHLCKAYLIAESKKKNTSSSDRVWDSISENISGFERTQICLSLPMGLETRLAVLASTGTNLLLSST